MDKLIGIELVGLQPDLIAPALLYPIGAIG